MIKRIRKSRAYRVIQPIVTLLLVGFALYYVGTKLAVSASQINWNDLWRKWPTLLLCWALLQLCIVLGALTYHLVLRGIGSGLPSADSFYIHLVSTLGQYLPGYGWHYLGKVYLSKKAKIPSWNAGVAVLAELIMQIATGVLVSAAAFSPSWTWLPTFLRTPLWKAVGILATLALLGLLPKALVARKLMSRLHREPGTVDVNAPTLWLAATIIVAAWILHGHVLYMLGEAFSPMTQPGWSMCVFSYAASVLLAMLAPFVPGGIGIREGALVYLLAPSIGAPTASLIAIIIRLLITGSQLLGAAVSWFYERSNGIILQKDY